MFLYIRCYNIELPHHSLKCIQSILSWNTAGENCFALFQLRENSGKEVSLAQELNGISPNTLELFWLTVINLCLPMYILCHFNCSSYVPSGVALILSSEGLLLRANLIKFVEVGILNDDPRKTANIRHVMSIWKWMSERLFPELNHDSLSTKAKQICSSFVFLSPHLCFHSLSILLSQSSSGTRIPMWSLFNTRSSFRGVSLIALKSYPNNFSILVFTPFFSPSKFSCHLSTPSGDYYVAGF